MYHYNRGNWTAGIPLPEYCAQIRGGGNSSGIHQDSPPCGTSSGEALQLGPLTSPGFWSSRVAHCPFILKVSFVVLVHVTPHCKGLRTAVALSTASHFCCWARGGEVFGHWTWWSNCGFPALSACLLLPSPPLLRMVFSVVISQTHWLVSQERLSPRVGTSVFIVYRSDIWWVVVLTLQLVCHTTLLPHQGALASTANFNYSEYFYNNYIH